LIPLFTFRPVFATLTAVTGWSGCANIAPISFVTFFSLITFLALVALLKFAVLEILQPLSQRRKNLMYRFHDAIGDSLESCSIELHLRGLLL
jgi:hypothetical protein